jgi:hypothetical protein
VGPASRPGPGDHVGQPIAVQIAAGHEDAAPEVWVVGVEAGAPHDGVAKHAEHLDVRSPARSRARDDLLQPVAIHVAAGAPADLRDRRRRVVRRHNVDG